MLVLYVQGVSVQGVYVLGGKCPGGKCPGGNMSHGGYVLGGKCPVGKCPGGKCPGGICPWGKCPGGTCPGGLCPRTLKNSDRGHCHFLKSTGDIGGPPSRAPMEVIVSENDDPIPRQVMTIILDFKGRRLPRKIMRLEAIPGYFQSIRDTAVRMLCQIRVVPDYVHKPTCPETKYFDRKLQQN